jgi:hypothetical protein
VHRRLYFRVAPPAKTHKIVAAARGCVKRDGKHQSTTMGLCVGDGRGTQVVARNSDTGAEVVMQRTGTHVVGSHSAEYEAALDAMGTWRLHMVAGGDRALLNTGDHSGIHVVPGHAVAGDFVELSTVQFMAYRTVRLLSPSSENNLLWLPA